MKQIFLSLCASMGLCLGCNAQDSIKTLPPQEFHQAIENDSTAIVIDVRQPNEFEEGHLDKALLLNVLDKESFNEGLKHLDKKNTYYLYCRSGRRSNRAALKMKSEGFSVVELKGGIEAWIKAEMPIRKMHE